MRAEGETYRDVRPLVRVNVAIVAGDGQRQESGSYGYGGREGSECFLAPERWQHGVRDALTTLRASPWIEPVPPEVGVRTFDVIHDILVKTLADKGGLRSAPSDATDRASVDRMRSHLHQAPPLAVADALVAGLGRARLVR